MTTPAGLRVLFLGGTGVISTAAVQEACRRGQQVSVINRGLSQADSGRAALPPEVELLQADVRDAAAMRAVCGSRTFDVVISFLAFVPEQVQQDIDLFEGRIGQYVFISSASAYQTPPNRLPVTESTPLRNPFSQYSRDKIACEELLLARYRDTGFPITIVRPSHTYDPTAVPFDGGWTVVERMRQGRPVIVPGDGSSLWTITHHEDFARAFVGLLGQPRAVGEKFHITSDEAPTWNQIYTTVGRAAGVEPKLLHVASRAIAAMDDDLGASLLGDKANSMIFDNAKLRTIVPGWYARIPFVEGAREIIAWHDADPRRRRVDPRMDALFDRIAATYGQY